MLRKASRDLKTSIKDAKRYGYTFHWNVSFPFGEHWLYRNVPRNFTDRNKSFEYFRPMMEVHLIEHYNKYLDVMVLNLADEDDSRPIFAWQTREFRPEKKKGFQLFHRRRH